MPLDPTPRSAYAHWNEEQDMMWWDEVGKHHASQADEPPDPDAYYESYDPREDDLDEEED